MNRRIILLGNSGSGKTTLGRELAVQYGIPRLSLDLVAWEGGADRLPLDKSLELIRQYISQNSSWVIEGCYGDLIEFLLPHATELRFLNPGIETCVTRVRARRWEPEKFPSAEAQQDATESLIAWIREYESRDDEYGLKRHRSIFEGFRGEKIEQS